jgi:hypothetical protein
VHILIQRCRALCKEKDSPCENLAETLLDRAFPWFLPNEPRQEQKLKSQRTAAARAEGSGCVVSLFSPRQGTMPVSGNISEEKLWRESLDCF